MHFVVGDAVRGVEAGREVGGVVECWNSASTALLCLACTTSSAPLHR